jgi:hypothetical protein
VLLETPVVTSVQRREYADGCISVNTNSCLPPYAIFRDAAIEKILGGFKVKRPTQPSYDAFEKSVEASYSRHRRQMELKLES